MSQHYDLLVIGSGPSGQRAAVQAAKLGKRAAVVERKHVVGGNAVHTGTIPSKTLRETVLNLTGWRERGFYGRAYRVKKDITVHDLKQRLQMTLEHEIEVMQHQLMRNGVDVIRGQAHFVDEHTVRVTESAQDDDAVDYTADYVVLAVGTRPHRPSHIPFDRRKIMDSDDILRMEKLPRTMAVIGGGVIGIEYATIFSALDINVTVVEARDQLLSFVDSEITQEFQHHMRDRGMIMRLGEEVSEVREDNDGKIITQLASGRRVVTDLALFCAGRQGNTDTLKLENAGLEADKRGRLEVNEQFQTAVPHIYGVGDVIGFPALASTSMEQGRRAARNALTGEPQKRLENFPIGIYSVPEISMAGRTEQELKDAGIPFESGIARFRETARGQILGLDQGMLKMLFSLEDHTLLGVHVEGEGATELVHIGHAVLELGGTLEYFIESVFNYPTLAEAYKVAALDAWNRLSR
ncbi:Si-specific NAD(P)(+) transhydrogenase [Halofilum ochraceum]|uniref:Si-specific NAD(P)(+) transhydrogenase n=1 Tax=Halofilum ochraceum TaxID=1611323 RepID=UPI00082D0237|nr:Si-specific NAD(P)(+) transhydrogenase [Halofilum ochraceum]